MITEWRSIKSFPGYSVSDTGLVRNDDNDRIMTLMVNQFGIVNVGLTKNYVQYKRAVSILVAIAFLLPPPQEAFDTPINLDGDRTNNRADNLMWRPRWFASQYFKQFKSAPISPASPLEEIDSGEKFGSPREAAIRYGLKEMDIWLAAATQSEVWPTYQRFREI
jgi:hypothetical protein